jgi:hypothetical protein
MNNMLDNNPSTMVNNMDGMLSSRTYQKTLVLSSRKAHKYNLDHKCMSYLQFVPEPFYYVDALTLSLLHPEIDPDLKLPELQLHVHRFHQLLLHVNNQHNYRYLNLGLIFVPTDRLFYAQNLLNL